MDNGGLFTQRLLDAAGDLSGCTVLDVGCGPGDVALRVARVVGPNGRVLGIDPNSAAIETAQARAVQSGMTHVDFDVRTVQDATELGTFDLITCRRVLMYLPDRAAVLRQLAGLLKPGGMVLLQEHDVTLRYASGPMPLADQASDWIWDTVRAEGADTRTGFALHQLLSEAGFARIQIIAEPVVETPSQVAQTADIVRAMIPRIEAAGVATAQDIAIDTLAARLEAERVSTGATRIAELAFGALAHRPL